MFRLVRIIVNSFAGCMMLIMGGIFWSFDPILAVVLFLASIDQFEDVYYFVYGKRLIPDWLMPVDVVFEGVVASLGLGIILFSIMYMSYFQTWFFQVLFVLAIPMVWSSVEDVLYWSVLSRTETKEVVACAFCKAKTRFVKRKK